MGRIFFGFANPIKVSNAHTKFGWTSFNGKGEDSITDSDDARKYLETFFSKILTCLRFTSGCVNIILRRTAQFGTYLQVFRLYLSSFHQVYQQYWNTGFFKDVHAPTYPLLVEGR